MEDQKTQQPETQAPITITQDEIQRILDVDQRWKAIVQELGNIGLAEMQLKDRRESIERFTQETKDLENKAAKILEDKYGKGTVDIKTGVFTPLV